MKPDEKGKVNCNRYRNGELGRCLLSIKKGSVIYEREYRLILPERDHTIRGGMGMAHDYKQKSR